MDLQKTKDLVIFCNQYYVLNHFNVSTSKLTSTYSDYLKNYAYDIDAYKQLFGTKSNNELLYNIVYDLNNKNDIFNSNNKILFLNLSTYYQSYFFELENLFKDNIYHLLYDGENQNQFLNKVMEKYTLNEDERENFKEKRARTLFGVKGIKQFIENKNIRFLRLNFDGGYFNKYFNLRINDELSIKLALGIFKLGYLAKADVIPCFWVKTNENDIILKLYPTVKYIDDFPKYKLSIKNNLEQCVTDFFNNYYPSQWIRWPSIHKQYDLNNSKYVSLMDTERSILIKFYNEMYLFDPMVYKIYKVNEKQYDEYKKDTNIEVYNITHNLLK
ncbi:MAG: hypothetical protein KAX49_16470 [Halanaerobiales bacterium]|nr:hypothetical protein [Halanaerobiales bacterium]